jgi:hypothetical protein
MRPPVTFYLSYAFPLLRPLEYPLPHSIVLHRLIALIFKIQIKVIGPKHRRPDRHNVTLMNPQQYFFGCASVPISASIDLNRVLQLNTFGVRSPSRLMNQKLFSLLSFGMAIHRQDRARLARLRSCSRRQPGCRPECRSVKNIDASRSRWDMRINGSRAGLMVCFWITDAAVSFLYVPSNRLGGNLRSAEAA